MSTEDLAAFVGEWELSVDLPGAEDVRGHVTFELMGEILVERATIPDPAAPDSNCVVVFQDGKFTQHYFDSRGIARLYDMTFDAGTWTLERTKADFTPLEFAQRYVGSFSSDQNAITGEWSTSQDGISWTRDFGLTYRRLATP